MDALSTEETGILHLLTQNKVVAVFMFNIRQVYI